jgi:hypothetical protein
VSKISCLALFTINLFGFIRFFASNKACEVKQKQMQFLKHKKTRLPSNIHALKTKPMNLKRNFGSLLTILGIIGLIYDAILFVNTPPGMGDVKALIIYTILSLIFFVAGINLVRTTEDKSS